MSSSYPITLDPDTIDDILYFARTNSLADLTELLSTTATSLSTNSTAILLAAIDPDTGNSALHMASANGHTGIYFFPKPIYVPLTSTILSTSFPAKPSRKALPKIPLPNLQTLILISLTTEIISHLLMPPPQESLLNSPNISGSTPLHYAALNGHLPAVTLLLAAGADPTVVNRAGHDAVYEAELNGKDEVARFILEKGIGLESGIGGKGGGVEGVMRGGEAAGEEGEEGEEREDVEMKMGEGDGVAVEMGGLHLRGGSVVEEEGGKEGP